MKSRLQYLNTLTAYVIGVIIVWAAIFAIGYLRSESGPRLFGQNFRKDKWSLAA
jgi:hypothetical protein